MKRESVIELAPVIRDETGTAAIAPRISITVEAEHYRAECVIDAMRLIGQLLLTEEGTRLACNYGLQVDFDPGRWEPIE